MQEPIDSLQNIKKLVNSFTDLQLKKRFLMVGFHEMTDILLFIMEELAKIMDEESKNGHD